ncbi:hypothetical protein HDV04_001238 [Boothiomyces sp. JEL0838]|nr:hypothetical protein HDV04_001238 [Boothiomyces sp. JEL0838]
MFKLQSIRRKISKVFSKKESASEPVKSLPVVYYDHDQQSEDDVVSVHTTTTVTSQDTPDYIYTQYHSMPRLKTPNDLTLTRKNSTMPRLKRSPEIRKGRFLVTSEKSSLWCANLDKGPSRFHYVDEVEL